MYEALENVILTLHNKSLYFDDLIIKSRFLINVKNVKYLLFMFVIYFCSIKNLCSKYKKMNLWVLRLKQIKLFELNIKKYFSINPCANQKK